MCFRPLPVRGRGEHFGIRTSRNKTVKGRRKKGRRAGRGTCLWGRWHFEGQVRGRSSIIGQAGGRGERCPSSSLKKRRRRTRSRKDRRERKEEQSIEL